MNLNQLISRAREITGDHSAKGANAQQWKDAAILDAINASHEALWNRARRFDEGLGYDLATFADLGINLTSVQGGVWAGALPKDVATPLGIETGWSGTGRGSAVPRIRRGDRFTHRGLGWALGTERSILFYGDTMPAASEIRLEYYRTAPRMVRFAGVSKSTTRIQVEINLDPQDFEEDGGLGELKARTGYYRNAYLECLDAGGMLPQSQEVMVGGWAVSVDGFPFWDFTVSVHAVTGGANTWATVPIWPEDVHELLAALAAMTMLQKGGEAVGRTILSADVNRMMGEFVEAMNNRDLAAPRYVVYRGDPT